VKFCIILREFQQTTTGDAFLAWIVRGRVTPRKKWRTPSYRVL